MTTTNVNFTKLILHSKQAENIAKGGMTQIRVPLQPMPHISNHLDFLGKFLAFHQEMARENSPFGDVGDVIWIPETIKRLSKNYMRQEQCRLVFEIKNLRIERLHDITARDAFAETGGTIESFIKLWKSANGTPSWNKNPYVWVITCKQLNNPLYNQL